MTIIYHSKKLFVQDEFMKNDKFIKMKNDPEALLLTSYSPLSSEYLTPSTTDKLISIRELYLFNTVWEGHFSLLLPFGFNTYYDYSWDLLPGFKDYHSRSKKSGTDRILSYIAGPFIGVLSIIGSIRSIISIIKNTKLVASNIANPVYIQTRYLNNDTKKQSIKVTKYDVCKVELSKKTKIILIATCIATIVRGLFECCFLGLLFIPGDLIHLAISKCYGNTTPFFEKISVKVHDQIKEKFLPKTV